MRRARENLSGFWVGRYAYEGSVAEPVQFLATIEESGGTLGGTISEPNQIGHSSKELHAFLSGTREGADVFFAKTYDGASDAAHRVDYFGQLTIILISLTEERVLSILIECLQNLYMHQLIHTRLLFEQHAPQTVIIL